MLRNDFGKGTSSARATTFPQPLQRYRQLRKVVSFSIGHQNFFLSKIAITNVWRNNRNEQHS